jgi:hypothetical protein
MTTTDRLSGLLSSVAIKAPCRVATTANITLDSEQAIDGVSVVSGDRVLVWNQTDNTTNGIYVCDTGTWGRDVDFKGTNQVVQGTIVNVEQGSQYGATLFQQTTANPVIGSTAITFAPAGSAALALASSYMRSTIFPLTTAAATVLALGALSSSAANTPSGNMTPSAGTWDLTSATVKVPTKTAGTNTTDAASTAFVKTKAEAVVGGTVLRSYLAGLGTSNNATTPNSKIDVAAGVCADDSNVQMLTLAATTLDCGTTGANGLDAGTLANSTWYHLFVIGKTDGTTALLASTSISSPTYPSGYTLKRRIGEFKTDGSAHILAYVQDGDRFSWSAVLLESTSANPGTSAVTQTLANVPTGVRVEAVLHAAASTTFAAIISDLSASDQAPSLTAAPLGNVGGGASTMESEKRVFTNSSAQVRTRISASGGGQQLYIATLGWIDRRGRDA